MLSLSAAVVGASLHAPPATASPVDVRPAAALAEDLPKVPVPPLVTEAWNGTTGVPTLDERWRKAVADVADFTAEPEVRDAALAALATGDPVVIRKFATVDKPALDKQILARARQIAADNLAKIRAMAGTGPASGYFNAEVERVLAGTDRDREAFLAYGADIARERDAQVGKAAQERAAALRARVRMVATATEEGSHVRQAAQAALAGNDAAISAFLDGGYLAAAKADAEAREQHLKDLEARDKAAENLTELAQRAARASEARLRLLAAHGDAVRALQETANAMASAANAARHSARVLSGTTTVQQKAAELATANAQATRDLGQAQDSARDADVAARTAALAADDLTATGLDYGAEWSLISQGMSEAATAAVGATETAQHAIDATIATNNAQGAQAQAEAHARQAERWRKHAQEHAKSAAKLAAAAKRQADAAKTAAARTKKARQDAQDAEAKAWAAAERTREHRQTAQAQAAEAKRQRQIAEAERANAARFRAEAEQQAAIARSERANAEAQAAAAAGARQRAEAAESSAGAAADRAWEQEGKAAKARDQAIAAERAEQTAKAKAAAMRSAVAAAASDSEKREAQRQADEADAQAGVAGTAARSARSSANNATGAAANARAAASQAQQAADRAWVAAERAAAAAAAADAAADKAEASAKATHAARVRADAKAARATAQEVKAARAADAAVRLAEQAADEAVRSLWAANRTKDEAAAATTEAVAAAAQAEIAVNAAVAARQSAAGIADPANAAIGSVRPFTGADIDADFVTLVAEQAKTIGAEQAAAATARAAEAVTAAQQAEAAAGKANDQVKPAFAAAAQAARSAAEAAASAAEAKKAAAQAAVDGAAARTAAAGAGRADAQARADATLARQAANAAAGDAAIAGQAAQAAQNDADAADSAATAAEADAAAARGAADQAEADAADALKAAENAQKYADSAATAAANALQHAVEAQKAAERAEEAERKRKAAALAEATTTPPAGPDSDLMKYLSAEERAALIEAQKLAGQNLLDFLKENAFDLFMDLSGVGDIKSCIMDGNVEACLWSLVNLLPANKILNATWDLAKLLPKLFKFLDKVDDAAKKQDELVDLAKRKKRDADVCKVSPKPSSFLPGTRVLLPGGATRAIEQLKVGDRVVATDPETGVTAARTVTDTITSAGDKSLVDVTIDVDGGRGDRTAILTATYNHPFWVPKLSEWVQAAQLTAGQWLRTSAGTRVKIAAVRHHAAVARVHNLTVADLHTYYVVAGGRPVLVHNDPAERCKGSINRNALSDDEFVQSKEIIDELGGHFEGQNIGNEAGIDGIWNNLPASLKEVSPGSLDNVKALKSAADKARKSVLKAGHGDKGAVLFIKATGVSAAEARGIEHLAKMAGGRAFSRVSIRTKDGWVHYGA
ncbi:hypothetical protein DMB66_34810 [Actinoplanes sp. ATCC 53533]|nr:hypothetical protein DMB66_34810 [Actinoplanes sp. ATCC 53533]